MDNIWKITNYDVYFGGKIYPIVDDLANKLQKDPNILLILDRNPSNC